MKQPRRNLLFFRLFLAGVFCLLFSGLCPAAEKSEGHFEFYASYGRIGHGEGEFRHPDGMAFSPDGSLLAVCDTDNHRVVLLRLLPPEKTLGQSQAAVKLFRVEKTFGGIWPFEGSNLPADPVDSYLEADHADGVMPVREVKGRAFHGGQARIRPGENVPMDRYCRPETLVWLDDKTILVTDTENHRVKAQRLNGEISWILGEEGWKNGYFHHPMGIAVNASGSLFITEPRSNYLRGVGLDLGQRQRVQGNRMQVFDGDLKVIKRLGHMHHMSGRRPRQYKDLTRVFITSEEDVYLTDTGNHRILVLDGNLKGKKILEKWPFHELRHPYGVHVDAGGRVAIADTGHHQILIVDKNGDLKQILGKRGAGKGEFSFPREVRFGPDGALYILDTMNSRIQVFRDFSVELDKMITDFTSITGLEPSLDPGGPASGPAFATATPLASTASPTGSDAPAFDKNASDPEIIDPVQVIDKPETASGPVTPP